MNRLGLDAWSGCVAWFLLMVLASVAGAGNPEICNGVDDDGNGSIDDNLMDTPPIGQGTCWSLPGMCCTVAGVSWCPPPGGTCHGSGALSTTAPATCRLGTLTCAGVAGWVCNGSVAPSSETCDGLDNDCDALVDDNPTGGPPAGQTGCWNQPGNCCTLGSLTYCPPPGATCFTAGTLSVAPGSQCRIGTAVCNSGWSCTGTIAGPSVEVCDGIDNDCDGMIDEALTPDCPVFVDGFEQLPP